MVDADNVASTLHCGSLDEFAAAVGDLPVPWAFDTRSRRFNASLETRRIGALHFADVRYGPCSAKQTRFGNAADPQMCLTIQRCGRQGMFWSDHSVVIEPGEIILWDNARPMRVENDAAARSFNFWFPAKLAEQRVGSIGKGVGVKAAATHGLPKMIGQYMTMMLDESDAISSAHRARMLDIAIDMMSMCFVRRFSEERKPRNITRIADAAEAHILACTHMDELTPASVAAAVGSSVRSLQSAFAQRSTTFSAFVMQTKLERAKHALLSNEFRHLSITDIAHWFGFFDSSHLARSFRKKFGINPSSFRNGTGVR